MKKIPIGPVCVNPTMNGTSLILEPPFPIRALLNFLTAWVKYNYYDTELCILKSKWHIISNIENYFGVPNIRS